MEVKNCYYLLVCVCLYVSDEEHKEPISTYMQAFVHLNELLCNCVTQTLHIYRYALTLVGLRCDSVRMNLERQFGCQQFGPPGRSLK